MHWFKTIVAPILGGVGCLYVAYLLNDNRTDLAAGNPLFIKVRSVGRPVVLRHRRDPGADLPLDQSPRSYEAIGRYVHSDA